MPVALSFIVPADNEESSIMATVRAIATAVAAVAAGQEIIVVDDASTDRTAELAAAAGARVVPVALRQIAAVRNADARAAAGPLFVFVDADTPIGAEVVAGLCLAIAVGAVGDGAAVRFDEPTPRWLKLVLPSSIWLARRLRITGGCFLFCTRAAFEAVGGFDEALLAAEEIRLCRALRALRALRARPGEPDCTGPSEGSFTGSPRRQGRFAPARNALDATPAPMLDLRLGANRLTGQ